MANHPNRGWRSRMRAACGQWMLRLIWPTDGVGMLTPDQMRDLMREAYYGGYEDGRRKQP